MAAAVVVGLVGVVVGIGVAVAAAAGEVIPQFQRPRPTPGNTIVNAKCRWHSAMPGLIPIASPGASRRTRSQIRGLIRGLGFGVMHSGFSVSGVRLQRFVVPAG